MVSLSRRLFLGATAALGMAGSAQATGSQSRRQTANGSPPWEQDSLEQGHQLPPQRLADTDTYDNEPNITRLVDDTLLLIYRRASTKGGGHVNNTGRIVARLSNDWGETWSGEIEVANHPDYDTRNQSIIYDRESGTVSVHYRLYDAQTGAQPAELYKYSTDGGRSWSEPRTVELDYVSLDLSAPFGGYTRTSNGLMTQWYGFDREGDYGVVEALFSTDGGRTWGNNVLVGDSTAPTNPRVLTEPVPTAYTEDKIWTFGRDNATADMFVMQSEDGGLTWTDPEYFNPTGMTAPTPAWFKRTNANEVTVIWGDRTNNRVNVIQSSARLLWQDPTLLEEQPVSPLAVQMSGNEGDFGYVTFAQMGADRRHTLVTYYDEDHAPNIWLMSLD